MNTNRKVVGTRREQGNAHRANSTEKKGVFVKSGVIVVRMPDSETSDNSPQGFGAVPEPKIDTECHQ